MPQVQAGARTTTDHPTREDHPMRNDRVINTGTAGEIQDNGGGDAGFDAEAFKASLYARLGVSTGGDGVINNGVCGDIQNGSGNQTINRR
jgi:hypothetical protein